MPERLPQKEEHVPAAEKMSLDKERIFAEIGRVGRVDAIHFAKRVFEHSIEDGLELFEQLRFDPEETWETVARKTSWDRKHPEVAKSFLGLKEAYSLKTQEKMTFESMVRAIQLMQHKDNFFPIESEKLAPELESIQRDINSYYGEILKMRTIAPKETVDPALKLSEGERIAARHLSILRPALDEEFYAYPIFEEAEKVLAGLPDDEAKRMKREIAQQQGSSTLPDTFVAYLFDISPEEAHHRFAKDRVTVSSTVYKTGKGIAINELSKELEKEVGDGAEVVPGENEKYEVKWPEPGAGAEKKKGPEVVAEFEGPIEKVFVQNGQVLIQKYDKGGYVLLNQDKKVLAISPESQMSAAVEVQGKLVIQNSDGRLSYDFEEITSNAEQGSLRIVGDEIVWSDGQNEHVYDPETKKEIDKFPKAKSWQVGDDIFHVEDRGSTVSRILSVKTGGLKTNTQTGLVTGIFPLGGDEYAYTINRKGKPVIFGVNVFSDGLQEDDDVTCVKTFGDVAYVAGKDKNGANFLQVEGQREFWPGEITQIFDLNGDGYVWLEGGTLLKRSKDGSVDRVAENLMHPEKVKIANGHLYFFEGKQTDSFVSLKNETGEEIMEIENNPNVDTIVINNRFFVLAGGGGVTRVYDENGEGVSDYFVAESNPGVPKMFERNGKLAVAGWHDGKYIVEEIAVDEEDTEKEKTLTPKEQKKLDLINLVAKPDVSGIDKFMEEKQLREGEKERIEGSRSVAEAFNAAILEDPQAFLRTMAAKRDTNPDLLARRLFRKLFPNARLKEQKSFGNSFLEALGFKSEPGAKKNSGESNPENFFADQNQSQFEGGGRETIADDREVLTLRDAPPGLIASAYYGTCDKENGAWNKVSFTVARPQGELVATTAMTAPLGRLSEASLPLPVGAAIIRDRVHAVDASGKETQLIVEEDALGEAKAFLPKELVGKNCRVSYSFEVPKVPPRMREVDAADYSNFKKRLPKELTESLATLDEEVDLFLRDIADLPPKQKVIAIEKYVREHSYYDFDNLDTTDAKRNKSLSERIGIARERVSFMRENGMAPAEALAGKKYAGVCPDFAGITAAMLRRAGFAAGVMSGFKAEGKKVTMGDSHGAAYVVWPDEKDESGNYTNTIFTVDGSPGTSQDERLADIAAPSLEEHEEEIAKIEQRVGAEAVEGLAQAEAALAAVDVKAIEALQNGKLEKLLNQTLQYSVKKPHVDTLARLFDYCRYSPDNKLDLKNLSLEDRIGFGKRLEGEVFDARLDATENLTSADIAQKAGTEFLHLFQENLQAVMKEKKIDRKQAAEEIKRIISFADRELSPTERKAAAVTIAYLEAEKMAPSSPKR